MLLRVMDRNMILWWLLKLIFRLTYERVFRKIFWLLTGHRFHGDFTNVQKGEDGRLYVYTMESFEKPVSPKRSK